MGAFRERWRHFKVFLGENFVLRMTIGNQAVFTTEHLGSTPHMVQSPYAKMPGFTVTVIGIHKFLLKLNPSKPHGPEANPNNILKEIADQIAPFVSSNNRFIRVRSPLSGKMPTFQYCSRRTIGLLL